MSVPLKYVDTIKLVKPVIDKYGTNKIGQVEEVKCIFITRTGFAHTNNQEVISTESSVYIDPENEFVLNNSNRLERFFVIASRFGSDEGDSWYKVVNVSIGMDKLLNNKIDHIKLTLDKTAGIKYVS